MLKKIFLATLFIYYGWEAYAHLVNPEQESNCLGWICEKVQCPPGYAVYIPEEGRFLPCEHWTQYVEIGNKSVLR